MSLWNNTPLSGIVGCGLVPSSLCLCLLFAPLAAHAQDIAAPPGSGSFGQYVAVLPNGNLVVADPRYDPPGPEFAVGAVYLYRPDRTLISRLTGTTTNDQVGQFGIVVLPSGNFLVLSSNWDNGTAVDAGAVTFVNAHSGLNGAVSAANSLVGSSNGDQIGVGGIDLLTNGNYVVVSSRWDNGSLVNAGAVTWGSATQGVAGAVSAVNSLVGASANDQAGNPGTGASNNGVVALSNGNYVVSTASWDNGAIADVGAMTWGNGNTGTSGVVSAANSLIGSTAGEAIGTPFGTDGRALPLSNGHYVVTSRRWDNGATLDVGAVTWCDGTQPTSAVVSAANSLIGSTADDRVGERVFALTNGNYVVASSWWDTPGFPNVGAVTWRNGTGAFPTVVSASNSLVGVYTDERVGGRSLIALTNGHYVQAVRGIDVQASLEGRGAVIWADGTSGISGPVTSAIGLVGGTAGDFVGSSLQALTNGNYVVISFVWANGGAAQAGAVTWRDGSGASSAVVSAANSLVGTTAGDRLGIWGVLPLSNGNYVVGSPDWSNGSAVHAGAVTWGNGLGGTAGPVSAANSLVGTTSEERLGDSVSLTALTDGSYTVANPNWDNGGVLDVGAVTWGSGSGGLVGTIDPSNSLVGTTAGDRVGGVLALPGGRYAVVSGLWDYGASVDAGATTLGKAGGSTTGTLTELNSLLGNYEGGATMDSWDPNRERLAVGRGYAVSFISYEAITFDGFE